MPNEIEKPMEPFSTVNELGNRWRIKAATIRKWMVLGRLRYKRFGRCVRIPKDAIEEFEAQNDHIGSSAIAARPASRQQVSSGATRGKRSRRIT